MAVFIIAEAGVNHNGSVELAKQMITVAAKSKIDAIKFQTFKANKLVTKNAEKADYQKKFTGSDETQFDMIKRLELRESDYKDLMKECEHQHIEFLSSAFDIESLHFLLDLGIKKVKIPSGEITNIPLLIEAGKSSLPTILSTGMATLGDIEVAIGALLAGMLDINQKPTRKVLEAMLSEEEANELIESKITILHCTTEYPAPFPTVNLHAMATLRQCFNAKVGYSDHTAGISIPIAAVALGAEVIEKHFTLDKNLPGPDHKASLDPLELANMVGSIREVEQALGRSSKFPNKLELRNKELVRRSLVATQPIAKGDLFTLENISLKRPGSGISPLDLYTLLGKKSTRDYQSDELIEI